MIAAPATKIVCSHCKKGKRKCEGGIPCLRCSRLGRADECVVFVASKKREKEEDEVVEEKFIESFLEGQMNFLVSILLSHSQNVLRERPGDAMMGLGLTMENYVVVEINPIAEVSFEHMINKVGGMSVLFF